MVEIMMARLRCSEAGASVLPVTCAGEHRLGMIGGENKMPSPRMERQGDLNARSKYLQYDSYQDSCAH
jgi:hypothetical protein